MIQNPLYSPILITGIERSGSSIIAKIIEGCGSFAGDVTEMSENRGIKKLVDTYYSEQLHLPVSGQKPLPITEQLNIPVAWDKNIEEILQKDGYFGETAKMPWMYKSSRISQIWPIWNYSYPNAKWIIVRRRTGDIVQSCLKTGFMNAYSDQEGWLEWVHLHQDYFVDMINAGLNCKVVWPERMAYGDYQQIYEMLEWLGLPWNDDIIYLCGSLLKNSTQKERSK